MDVKIKTENLKFKFRVSAIFIYEGYLLVNEYGSDGSFCLPGGYVNLGETSEEAMLRELKEEIGLEFKIDKFVGITENFFTNWRNQKTHGIDFYYKVDLKSIDDFNLIDYNRVENDNGSIITHHFHLIDIDKLDKFNLLPVVIKKDIVINNGIFHYIIKDNK